MKIRIDFRKILREVGKQLEAALIDEIERKVLEAAGIDTLSPSARREFVIGELAASGQLDGVPQHLVNLAIEAAVAELKAKVRKP